MPSVKSILTGACVGLLLSTTACDDFVEVEPINEINSENFFNSAEDYERATIAAYDMLSSTYLNVITAEIASDNALAGGESANDVPGWQEIDDMQHGPVNDQLRNIWNWMYAGINRANYVFEFQDALDFEGKDVLLAEVAFLRAYYYFELVKYFGDVPLPVDKRVLFGEETGFDRAPRAQVYDQIEADLRLAIDRLPVTQPEVGRVTQGAARALLGKAHLYQGEFAEAATTLEALINANTYMLVEDFADIWTAAGENGPEAVFEVQYTDVQGAGFGCFACSEGNIMVGFSGVRAYNGPIYADGFSFNILTPELNEAYSSGDERYEPTVFDIDAFIESQDEEISFVRGFEHTGFFNHKYIPRQGEQINGDVKLTSNRNYRAIRYADVLLMAAEAFQRTGNDDRARQYLNRVRARAGLEDITQAGDALLGVIYDERRLELAGEGHRFFDLVRTGRAAAEIDGFVAGKHEVFPIPLIEIELAGGRWEQNPGY